MANNIKIQYTEITNALREIQAKLDDLQTVYGSIQNNSVLVNDSWQSEAALRFVSNINNQAKKLKETVDSIKKECDLIEKTSKKVIDSDKKLANQFNNIIEE